MIEIRFRDIDPDSGGISQDMKIAETSEPSHANWIKHALAKDEDNDPNREFYLVNLEDPNRELTYAERIAWFIANYYETGMEYEILLESMKADDLDRVQWIDGVISIPRTLGEARGSVN